MKTSKFTFEINWPLICDVNFMHSFVTTKLARVLKICTKTQASFYFIWHLKRSKSTYATKYVCALCTYYSRAITYTNHVYEAIGLKRDASTQWSQCIFKVWFPLQYFWYLLMDYPNTKQKKCSSISKASLYDTLHLGISQLYDIKRKLIT